MGFRIKKSYKIGGVRLNLSKSGIGASVGVKGARVGISGKGKAYTSIGGKRITSTSKSYKINIPTYSRKKTSVKTSTPVYEGLSTAILGLSVLAAIGMYPENIAAPVLMAVMISIYKIIKFKLNSKIKKFKKNLMIAIEEQNIELIETTLNSMKSKNKKKKISRIYIESYSTFLNSILSDLILDDKEVIVLNKYQEILPDDICTEINEIVLQYYLDQIIEDELIDETEDIFLTRLLKHMKISKSAHMSLKKEIESYKLLGSILNNDLKPIEKLTDIKINEPYYVASDMEIYKSKKINQEKTYILDKKGKIIISDSNIHIISEGHRKIKNSDVVMVKKNRSLPQIELTIQNRKTPIYIDAKNDSMKVYGHIKKICYT